MENDDDSYEVGFRKPPKHTQFRKGVSGNPKGRPKRSRSLASMFRRISEEKVLIHGPMGPRYITKMEAGITQLTNKAATGDLRAIREWIQLKKEVDALDPPDLPNQIEIMFVSAKDGRRVKRN